ncbi:hypothetical protein EIP91_005471 [Steccherinum ochraceum]|uniref:F-box domain-containing protein n=1 Tax=Steccherinum ochraceum TaxID=92696 RepID=A0A4R0RXI1_9APHY|nr:hypothetical protein EIP91_005471 [Steccherinum ochraceum]
MADSAYLDSTLSHGDKITQAQDSRVLLRPTTQSSIDMLPPELLVEIFHLHILSVICQYRESYSWIRIAHVCHRWRVIALAAPILWTHIYFDDRIQYDDDHPGCRCHFKLTSSPLNTCVPEMLARSGNALLDVYFLWSDWNSNSWSSDVFAVVRALISSLSRAHTFTFITHGCYHKEQDAWLQDLIPSKAPYLSSLSLTGPDLLPLFAQCDTPALRGICLSPAASAWSRPRALQHPLTRLRLHKVQSGDLSALLLTLKALPSLEELTVRGGCACMSWSHPHPVDYVSLPRLKSLKLAFKDGTTWLALYERLRIPSSTIFILNVLVPEFEDVPDLHCDQFAPTFLSRLQALTERSGKHICGVAYRSTDYDYGTTGVELYTTNNPDWLCFTSSHTSSFFSTFFHLRPPLRLTLEYESQGIACRPVFLQFLYALPLSQTTWLSVGDLIAERDGYTTAFQGELRSLIEAKMANLTTLCLAGRQTTEMVVALLSGKGTVGEEQWLVPHLTTLYLSEAVFRWQEARTEHDPSPFKDELMKVLVDRASAGAYVRRVVLSGCYGVWEQDIAGMRETMGRADWLLEWDGVDSLDVIPFF